ANGADRRDGLRVTGAARGRDEGALEDPGARGPPAKWGVLSLPAIPCPHPVSGPERAPPQGGPRRGHGGERLRPGGGGPPPDLLCSVAGLNTQGHGGDGRGPRENLSRLAPSISLLPSLPCVQPDCLLEQLAEAATQLS